MVTEQKCAHTPGPWRIGNPSEFGTHNPSIVFANSGEAITQCYGVPLHTTLEELDERSAEGLANARLIAAAPEMAEWFEENSFVLELAAVVCTSHSLSETAKTLNELAKDAKRLISRIGGQL